MRRKDPIVRPFNFSAGPAALPEDVLREVAAEMLDWHGSGMSVMEMSHRGREFMSIYESAQADLRELLAVPDEFRILFMQGGGIAENAIVPLNLSRGHAADFVISGSWSIKSHKEAKRYCDARIASRTVDDGQRISQLPPASWQISSDTEYLHICSNETIDGLEFHTLPDLRALGCNAPLVVDFSSHATSRPVDWSRIGLAFAGAQKNIGPAGLTLVFVRESLLDRALPICPSAFNYRTVADNDSMFNTPPTFAIYVAGLVFKWLKRQIHETPAGTVQGVAAMEERSIAKSAMLYDYIDGSGFYRNRIDPACRSRMNVPFFLIDDKLNDSFLAGAQAAGLLQLKGHKSVGGMRASLYNAVTLDAVRFLVSYMREFAARHG